MRLFLATYLNTECRERLQKFQSVNTANIRAETTLGQIKISWIPVEKLHMTWNFLGQVQESLLPQLIQSVENALENYGKQNTNGVPLPLVSFEQPTIWPRLGSPRLVVVQPKSTSDDFNRLGHLLRGHTNQFVEKDKGEHFETFKPHITLARLGGFREDTSRLKLSLSDFSGWEELLPILLDIASVDLISSQTGRGTNAYRTVQQFSINKFHKPSARP